MADPEETPFIWEQGEAALINLAKMISSYREELLKQGFNRREAMEMCLEYQRIVLNQAK